MNTNEIAKTDFEEQSFVSDLRCIVNKNKERAYSAVCIAQVVTNWQIGRRIVEQEQQGKTRAEYGKRIIELASKALTEEFGKGYSISNLKSYRRFFIEFQDFAIGQTPSDQSSGRTEKEKTLFPHFTLPPTLCWSHYERLMRVDDKKARYWYMNEAARETWSVKTLARNISSQYYYRLMQTPESMRAEVEDEMHSLTAKYENHKLEYLKNPIVAEFLNLPQDTAFTENKLEEAIISNLQKFLLEMGKGYAFVARQQHIKTDMGTIISIWFSITIY